jgi:hypothetical protein
MLFCLFSMHIQCLQVERYEAGVKSFFLKS